MKINMFPYKIIVLEIQPTSICQMEGENQQIVIVIYSKWISHILNMTKPKILINPSKIFKMVDSIPILLLLLRVSIIIRSGTMITSHMDLKLYRTAKDKANQRP